MTDIREHARIRLYIREFKRKVLSRAGRGGAVGFECRDDIAGSRNKPAFFASIRFKSGRPAQEGDNEGDNQQRDPAPIEDAFLFNGLNKFLLLDGFHDSA